MGERVGDRPSGRARSRHNPWRAHRLRFDSVTDALGESPDVGPPGRAPTSRQRQPVGTGRRYRASSALTPSAPDGRPAFPLRRRRSLRRPRRARRPDHHCAAAAVRRRAVALRRGRAAAGRPHGHAPRRPGRSRGRPGRPRRHRGRRGSRDPLPRRRDGARLPGLLLDEERLPERPRRHRHPHALRLRDGAPQAAGGRAPRAHRGRLRRHRRAAHLPRPALRRLQGAPAADAARDQVQHPAHQAARRSLRHPRARSRGRRGGRRDRDARQARRGRGRRRGHLLGRQGLPPAALRPRLDAPAALHGRGVQPRDPRDLPGEVRWPGAGPVHRPAGPHGRLGRQRAGRAGHRREDGHQAHRRVRRRGDAHRARRRPQGQARPRGHDRPRRRRAPLEATRHHPLRRAAEGGRRRAARLAHAAPHRPRPGRTGGAVRRRRLRGPAADARPHLRHRPQHTQPEDVHDAPRGRPVAELRLRPVRARHGDGRRRGDVRDRLRGRRPRRRRGRGRGRRGALVRHRDHVHRRHAGKAGRRVAGEGREAGRLRPHAAARRNAPGRRARSDPRRVGGRRPAQGGPQRQVRPQGAGPPRRHRPRPRLRHDGGALPPRPRGESQAGRRVQLPPQLPPAAHHRPDRDGQECAHDGSGAGRGRRPVRLRGRRHRAAAGARAH